MITFKPTFPFLGRWVFSCLLLNLSSCQQSPPPLTTPKPLKAISSPSASHSGYLGLSSSEAIAKATQAGLRSRVVKIDGKSRLVTKDYRPNRLNFTIEKGKVTRVTKG